MIIASYENEPFGIMLPSFLMFRDIQGHFPHVSTIRLPDVRDDVADHDSSFPETAAKLALESHVQPKMQPVRYDNGTTAKFRPVRLPSGSTILSGNDPMSHSVTSLTSIEELTGGRHDLPSLGQILGKQIGKTGPSIGQTINAGTLFYKANATTYVPVIISLHAVINKGLLLEDDEWTSHRRNHFAYDCSYTASPDLHQPVYLKDPNTGREFKIHSFVMGLSAVAGRNKLHEVEVVQHSAKRGKEQIVTPGKVILGPYQTTSPPAWKMMPTEHHFARLQFKETPSNDGKRSEIPQPHRLVFELRADIGEGQKLIRVAWATSERFIVRGRSSSQCQSEPVAGPTQVVNLSIAKKERFQHGLERSQVHGRASPRGTKPGNNDVVEKRVYWNFHGFGISESSRF